MNEPETVPLSAWCTMPPGITSHRSAHLICQMRLESGRIAECGCPDHARGPDAVPEQ